MKRNSLVISAVLFILAVFAWAGWANWEYRKQAAEQLQDSVPQGEMSPNPDVSSPDFMTKLMGKQAPAFTLEDLSGKKVSLANYKGKAVLINFWATWCAPCKIETPWLIELRNQFAPQGFEVLGISSEGDDATPGDTAEWNKDKAAVEKFVQEEKVPYPVLMGGDSLSEPYDGLDALPVSYFVNRNGKVVAAQMGLTSKAEIEANIKKALGAGK